MLFRGRWHRGGELKLRNISKKGTFREKIAREDVKRLHSMSPTSEQLEAISPLATHYTGCPPHTLHDTWDVHSTTLCYMAGNTPNALCQSPHALNMVLCHVPSPMSHGGPDPALLSAPLHCAAWCPWVPAKPPNPGLPRSCLPLWVGEQETETKGGRGNLETPAAAAGMVRGWFLNWEPKSCRLVLWGLEITCGQPVGDWDFPFCWGPGCYLWHSAGRAPLPLLPKAWLQAICKGSTSKIWPIGYRLPAPGLE